MKKLLSSIFVVLLTIGFTGCFDDLLVDESDVEHEIDANNNLTFEWDRSSLSKSKLVVNGYDITIETSKTGTIDIDCTPDTIGSDHIFYECEMEIDDDETSKIIKLNNGENEIYEEFNDDEFHVDTVTLN